MRQIEYNNAALTLSFSFPSDWAVQNITDVTIGVKDIYGNELLAATSATLWDGSGATQINGALETYDTTAVIELTGAGSLPTVEPGQRLQIADSAAGPAEEIEVLHYNSGTKTITVERDIRYDHSDNTAIKGLFCTYDLDTSTVADWTLGKQLVFTWTPDTDDLPCTERGEIVVKEFSVPGFNERFENLHPREFHAATDPDNRLPMFLSEAHKQLGNELMLHGLTIDRVVDQELLIPSLMSKVRWLVLLNGDDAYTTEREVCMEEYGRQFALLTSAPIWTDTDQDEHIDIDEFEDHAQFAGAERGL